VQIKAIINHFNMHLGLHAVRKIRLRYNESDFHARYYHTSQRVFITLRSLRPKYRFAGGFKLLYGERAKNEQFRSCHRENTAKTTREGLKYLVY
jgi:hypothetical protein